MQPDASHPPAPDALVAWHYLLQVSSRVVREFERRFDLEHRISAKEFDVLINLGAGPLRMTELANATMLSSGGLTRLVGRLEDRGLVQRDQDADDARSFRARLTERGAAMLAAARTTHDAIIQELVGARLPADEVASLGDTLGRILGPDRRT